MSKRTRRQMRLRMLATLEPSQPDGRPKRGLSALAAAFGSRRSASQRTHLENMEGSRVHAAPAKKRRSA